jgi:hypothetical protein
MSGVERIRFVFRLVDLMAKNVCNHKLLDQSWLEQVLETMLGRNVLRLADAGDDFAYIVHCMFGVNKTTLHLAAKRRFRGAKTTFLKPSRAIPFSFQGSSEH